MTDQRIYRIACVCSLPSIATFFIEFPFYLVRSAFPSMAEASKLPDFAVRNATNIMTRTCYLLIHTQSHKSVTGLTDAAL